MARTLGRIALDAIDLPGRMAQMVFEAKSVASAMGLPDQFISHIKARRVSDTHWQLYNDWRTRDYHTRALTVPLGRFFEYGTKDHLVLPVYAKALAWKESYGGKQFPQFSSVKGEITVQRYSRGHIVSGLQPLEPMTTAWRRKVADLRRFIADDLPRAVTRQARLEAQIAR